jgi:hypothetical protein
MSWPMVDAVLSRSQARGHARLLLVVIADRADPHGVAWPGIEDMARRAGMGRSTIFRLHQKLTNLGELRIEHRPGKTNLYTIVLPDPVTATRPKLGPVPNRDPSQTETDPSQTGTYPYHGVTPELSELSRTISTRASRVPSKQPTKGTAKKGTPEKPPPDPRVSALIAAFAEQHRQTLGTKYMVSGGRDGKAFKRALATFDESTIRQALAPYFTDLRSIEHIGADVPKFVGRIATLLATAPSNGARPASAYPDFTGHGQAAVRQRQQSTARKEMP